MSFEKVPNFLVNFFEAEMSGNETPSYRFNSFLLDVAERQLFHDDRPVPLTPKAFDVLAYLVERGGHLVLKNELMEAVWPDSFVDEVNLPRTIHTLRRTLGEDENGNKFIETVPTKGYRFVAKVNEVHEQAPQKSTNGKQSASPIAENFSETAFQIPPSATDETLTPAVAKPKHATRIVLFTVGFATAIFLIFLLSFNFSSVVSDKRHKPSQNSYPANDEAYRAYLLGAALADRWSRDDNRKAIENFERAIELDPNYAAAYAGLGNAHSLLAIIGGGGNSTEEYLKAKAAIEKALALDDSLAEAHSYFGELKLNFEWDFAGAEREHKRAVELDPNSSLTHRMYALFLSFLGRSDEALAEIKTAIDLEPSSILNHKIYGSTLYYARRYDEAIAEDIRTLDMGADFSAVSDSLVGSFRMKGDDDQAFEWFVRGQVMSEETPDSIQLWKAIYAQSVWRGIWERQLEQLKANEKVAFNKDMQLARLYIKLEDRDQAFLYLEKAFNMRSWAMISLKVNPSFDPIRSDPRFDDLLRRIGLK